MKIYPEVLIAIVCWPFVWAFGFQVLISLSPNEQTPGVFVFYGVILGALAIIVSIGISMVKLAKRNTSGLIGVVVNLAGLILTTLFPGGISGI